MSLCQLRPQALQHVGGLASEKLAIVPDIQQNYSLGKRARSNNSDCLSFGEDDLDLLGQEQLLLGQDNKHHCGYSISPSPEQQFHLVESEVFTAEVKDIYNFGASEGSNIFTCGGNSPVSTASASPRADFVPTGIQTSAVAGCQPIIDFSQLDLIPGMISQAGVSTHTDKYELVITEQPEEVCCACTCRCVLLKCILFLHKLIDILCL